MEIVQGMQESIYITSVTKQGISGEKAWDSAFGSINDRRESAPPKVEGCHKAFLLK